MKHLFLRRFAACLLALLTLLVFAGCSSVGMRPSSNARRVVATAGDIEITYDELYYLANSRIRDLKAEHGEEALEDPAVLEDLKAFVMENLYTRAQVLLAIGEEYGVRIDRGEIADNIDARLQTVLDEDFEGDRDRYVESLNEAFLTDRYVRAYIAAEDFVPSAIIREMLERGELDDSDAAARSFMEGEELIRVNQVLIERRNYVSAEAARTKAETLRAAVAAVADPAARVDAMRIAMQSSTYIDEGYGLYFARGEMRGSFESAAFALEEYGVSEVLEQDGDYYFLMRMPKEPAYIEQNFELLKHKSYFVHLNALVEERYAAGTLTLTDYGAGLDLAELPEIDAAGGELVIKIVMIIGGVAVFGGIFAVSMLAFKRHRAKHPKK